MSPISRRAGTREMVAYRSKVDEEIGYLEENLQRMTVGIPYVTTDDLPRCYQSHTARVSRQFSRLLHRVAQAIACYHE